MDKAQRDMANQQARADGAWVFKTHSSEYDGVVWMYICEKGEFQNPRRGVPFDARRLTGVKTTFNQNDKMIVYVNNFPEISSPVAWQVLDETGRVEERGTLDKGSFGFSANFSAPRFALPPGRHSFAWSVGDTEIQRINFTILPDPQHQLPKGAYELQDAECGGQVDVVTYNSYQNYEGDNLAHFPNDYVGIKNFFSSQEQILISLATPKKQAGYGIKIWDSNGNLTYNWVSHDEGSRITTTYKPGQLKSGSYTVAFYHNDHFIHKLGFVVAKDEAAGQPPPAQVMAAQPPAEQPKSADASLPKGCYNFTDPQYGNVTMLTCNSYQNVEGDNLIHYPSDFIGVKDTFSAKEKVTIWMSTAVSQTGYGIRIWDGSGNMVNDYVAKDKATYVSNESSTLAPGNYSAAFYHDGIQIKKIHFTVTN
jgi:hypothetical protein